MSVCAPARITCWCDPERVIAKCFSQVSMSCHSVRIFPKIYALFNVLFGQSSRLSAKNSAIFHIPFMFQGINGIENMTKSHIYIAWGAVHIGHVLGTRLIFFNCWSMFVAFFQHFAFFSTHFKLKVVYLSQDTTFFHSVGLFLAVFEFKSTSFVNGPLHVMCVDCNCVYNS